MPVSHVSEISMETLVKASYARNKREWLIPPDALRSPLAAADSFRAPSSPVVRDPVSSALLCEEYGVATVSIYGPIIRKPDIFARVLMGASDSEEINPFCPSRVAPLRVLSARSEKANS